MLSQNAPHYPLNCELPSALTGHKEELADLKYILYLAQLGTWFPINGMPYQFSITALNHDVWKDYKGGRALTGNQSIDLDKAQQKKILDLLMRRVSSSSCYSAGSSTQKMTLEFNTRRPTASEAQAFVDSLVELYASSLTQEERTVIENSVEAFIGPIENASRNETLVKIMQKILRSFAGKNQILISEDIEKMTDEEKEALEEILEAFKAKMRELIIQAGIPLVKVSVDSQSFALRKVYVELDKKGPSWESLFQNQYLSLQLHNFDNTFNTKLQEVSTKDEQRALLLAHAGQHQQTLEEAIKNVLFLAASAADPIHMTTLLADPQTLALAKQDKGTWLLQRVIESKLAIEPLILGTANVDATLDILRNAGLYPIGDEHADTLVEQYRQAIAQVAAQPTSSIASSSTAQPLRFTAFNLDNYMAPALGLLTAMAEAAEEEDEENDYGVCSIL